MRHPSRRRNLALVVAGLGVFAMVAAFGLVRRHGAGTFEVLLGVLGFKATMIGAILALVYHVRIAHRFGRLQRGEGVLVRWRIESARWRVFQEAAAALAQTAGALPNELKLPTEIPAEGIDVIITNDAFCLGPEFEPLEKNAVVRLNGPVLEIVQIVPVNRFQTKRAAYRLPTPANAEADVARLTDRYTAQATTARNHVRTTAWVALGLVLVALIWIVSWAMSVAHRG